MHPDLRLRINLYAGFRSVFPPGPCMSRFRGQSPCLFWTSSDAESDSNYQISEGKYPESARTTGSIHWISSYMFACVLPFFPSVQATSTLTWTPCPMHTRWSERAEQQATKRILDVHTWIFAYYFIFPPTEAIHVVHDRLMRRSFPPRRMQNLPDRLHGYEVDFPLVGCHFLAFSSIKSNPFAHPISPWNRSTNNKLYMQATRHPNCLWAHHLSRQVTRKSPRATGGYRADGNRKYQHSFVMRPRATSLTVCMHYHTLWGVSRLVQQRTYLLSSNKLTSSDRVNNPEGDIEPIWPSHHLSQPSMICSSLGLSISVWWLNRTHLLHGW